MKYIDWVDTVFEAIGKGYAEPANFSGLNLDTLANPLLLLRDPAQEYDVIGALGHAREDLYALGLLDASTAYRERMNRIVPYKPSARGKRVLHDGLRSLWEDIASAPVTDSAQQFLGAVAERSLKERDQFADASAIPVDAITSALAWSDDGGYALQQILNDPRDEGLIAFFGHEIRITYKGAVWVELNLAGWHKRWRPVEGSKASSGGQGSAGQTHLNW